MSELSDLQRRLGHLVLGGTDPLYSRAASLRADDLAVRSRASTLLGDLAGRLDARIRALPPPIPTRDQPATEALAARRRVRAVQVRVRAFVDAIAALPAPGADAMSLRLESEADRLRRLLACDVALLEGLEYVGALPLDDLPAISAALDEVDRMLDHRRSLLV